MTLTGMKYRFLLCILLLGVLGNAGCAAAQQSAPAASQPAAPAAADPPPQFSTPPPEVRATMQFSGVLVQVYHPETRTLYLWTGNPKPTNKQPMNCFKLQLSDTASGTPKREKCE